MKSRKVLALLLALSMTSALVTACGSSSSPAVNSSAGESSAATTTVSEEAPKVEKPNSITLMVDGTFLIKENGEAILEKGYEDLFGIDLIINHPVHNEYYEKVNLAFSSGNVPDVLIATSNYYLNFASNGALYDITDLYENSEIKNNIIDQSIIDSIRVDGRLYGLPRERGNGTITYVRGDWMDKLGISSPTNYEEFLTMLRRFKNENPDGLSPAEVIPITSSGLVNSEFPLDIYLREFYWTATPDFVKRGDTWVDGMTEDVMKDALQRMRDAYSEGLIDKEIITNQTSTCRDKFYAGTVGAFNYWAGTWNLNLYNNLTANIPDAKVVPIPPIKETKYVERAPIPICITTNGPTSKTNPEGVFEYFLATLLDNGDGQNFWTFGVKGEEGSATYTTDANGNISMLPSVEDPKKDFTKSWADPALSITSFAPKFEFDPLITNSLKMFQSNMTVYSIFPTSEAINDLLTEINSLKAKYVSKIVYSEVTIDEGLTQYTNEAKGMIEAILNDLNK